MEPNDPILIQRQQHEDNLRRQQLLEQQRRLEHQQLLEDEEREVLQREQRASAGGAQDTPTARRRFWPFGARKPAQASDAGARPGDDDLSDDPRDPPLEPSHTNASGMSTLVWVAALVLAAVLAWVLGPKLFGKSAAPPAPVAQTRADPSLPLAAPGDPLSVPGGPGLPDAAGAAVNAADPVAAPAVADPASELAQSLPAPESAASTPVATALAAPAEGVAAELPFGEQAVTGPEAAQLRERVALLEVRLANLQQALERSQPNTASGAASAGDAAAAPRPAPKRRRPAARAPARQAVAAVAATAPALISAEQRLRQQMQAELLAIDVWDGRPSVVVGTGVPGDQRVRVLQPGEQLNGVGLHAVDAAAGRATFSVGAGSLLTLDLKDARQP